MKRKHFIEAFLMLFSPTDGCFFDDDSVDVPREKWFSAGRRRYLLYEDLPRWLLDYSLLVSSLEGLATSSDFPISSLGASSFLASACFCWARSSILAL